MRPWSSVSTSRFTGSPKAWPAARPRLATLPSKLFFFRPTAANRGHKVSLACFEAPGGELHLFTLDRRAILAPPGAAPEFGSRAGWRTASWSDDRFVYILAGDMPESRLRTFL